MPPVRLGDFGAEFGWAVPVGGPGSRLEDVVASCPGDVLQIAVLGPGSGAAGGGARTSGRWSWQKSTDFTLPVEDRAGLIRCTPFALTRT
jgi:hypothetical protein